MIIRLVKMTFLAGKEKEFLQIFENTKHLIQNVEGCSHLELLRDSDNPQIFLTCSHWNSAKHLENYRNSELFNKVWSQVSVLFSKKAQAWSTEKIT